MKTINIIKSFILTIAIFSSQFVNSQTFKWNSETKKLEKTNKTEINSMQAKIKTTKGFIEKISTHDLLTINTEITNTLDCKININNIHELKFVRNLLISNRIIKDLDLKSIKLNENIYNIVYFGNFDVFKKSLERVRLNLFVQNDKCNIKLI